MKFLWIGFCCFILFAVFPCNAAAQKKDNELESQLAAYKGPFDITDVSAFGVTTTSEEPCVSISFKGPNGRIITATIEASSIEKIEDQNTVDNDGKTPNAPHTISFSFNVELIEQNTWKLIDSPAKFITLNRRAVQVEIHCSPEESMRYTP